MNKHLFFSLMGATALIGFTACQSDELMSANESGATQVVTFSTQLQNTALTRAFGDGEQANRLQYAIYQGDMAILDGEATIEGGTANVQVDLVSGQTYTIYFWADTDGNTAYTFNGNSVSIDYTAVVAGSDTADAFYASKEFTPSSELQHVTLSRPFAQLNLGTNDYAGNADKYFTIDQVAVTATAYNAIDLGSGAATVDAEEVTVTYTAALPEGETFPISGDYTYLSMGYLFVGESSTSTVEMTATSGTNTISRSFAEVPLKANYRTNIAGKLLTTTTDWEVIIDKEFDGSLSQPWDGESSTMPSQNEEGVYEINTAAELAGFRDFINGLSAQTRAASAIDFTLTADIDLNNQEWEPIGLTNQYGGTFDGAGFTISNLKVTEQAECAGLFAHSYGTIKNVTVKNVEIAGNFKLGAIIGDGLCSHIENCHVEGGMITATVRLNKDGLNDDANNVGGIVGYLSAEETASVKDCSVKDLTISAYRDLGGIAGTINNSGCEVSGNTVSNVTIIADRTVDYCEEKDVNAHELYGRCVNGGSLGEGNSFDNVEVMVKVDNAARLSAAVKGGAETVLLADGEYDVYDCKGKTFTLKGSKAVVLTPMHEGEHGCDYAFDGSTVTFDGITIDSKYNNEAYPGYARLTGTYNNCTFNGQYTAYNSVAEFNNCEFNVTGDVYALWTWGATTTNVNGCTFNTDGKAILFYGEPSLYLNVNDCVFIDNNNGKALKSAIEIASDWTDDTKTLVANNCNVDDWHGINPYGCDGKIVSTNKSKLWANKNGLTSPRLSVTIDGVKQK